MSEPVQSVLLTMLMSQGQASARSTLHSVIETRSNLVLAHGEGKNASITEIVFEGVSFILAFGDDEKLDPGLKSIFCNLDASSIFSRIDVRLGDHVAGGERVPAIIQAALGLAQKLGSELGAAAIIWHPAQIICGFDYFSEVVSDYRAGGAFPVLPLVNFSVDIDGVVHSAGLAILSGQELQVVNAGIDQIDVMRRVVRVVHDIAVNGPIRQSLQLAGIDPGERLDLNPVADGGILRVEIRRNFEP